MSGQKLTLSVLYFGCYLVVYNLFEISVLYGLVSSYMVILLLSHQQVQQERLIRGLEDTIIEQSLWGMK
jgi:hypothetical protein